MPIYEHSVACGDHHHLMAVIFTSKGEFYPGAGIQFENQHPIAAVFNKKMTASDVIRAGIPARDLVQGIQRAMHQLVIGKSVNMPMAQA